MERPASRTDVDSRRFAETVGRVDTRDWEQRIQGNAPNDTLPVVSTPPPNRRQKDVTAAPLVKSSSGKLTEESVNSLLQE